MTRARYPILSMASACLLLGCSADPQDIATSASSTARAASSAPLQRAAVPVPERAERPALAEAEVRAFYAPLDTLEGALDPERACGMLARDFEGRFDTRHPDGSTTQRVVGRDQTCDDARAGAIALRGSLEKGPTPTNAFDVVRVDIAADGQSAAAQYAQRFEIPGQLVIELRGTDTVVREDGHLAIRRSVGSEIIRNP